MVVKSAYLSDLGLIRENNEDFLLADDESKIYLLADGIGGHNAGEVASELAVKTVYAYLTKRLSSLRGKKICNIILDAIKAAHEAVNQKAKTDLKLMGMGSTLVTLVIRGHKAYTCHIGDSRIYHYHNVLKCMTCDHTMENRIRESNMYFHKTVSENQRHILTQAVGFGNQPMPDFRQIDISSGDLLLLCSDGLTDMLMDEEIGAIIKNGNLNIDSITQNLIASANTQGGLDNISVLLIKT